MIQWNRYVIYISCKRTVAQVSATPTATRRRSMAITGKYTTKIELLNAGNEQVRLERKVVRQNY